MAKADIKTAHQPLKAGYKMVSCRQGGPFSRPVYLEIPETLDKLPEGFHSLSYEVKKEAFYDNPNSIIRCYWQYCYITKEGYRYWIH